MKTRLGLLSAFALLPCAAKAQAPLPPPTPDEVKACVQQVDLGRRWTFDWKTIEVGPPRHPQNPYERVGLAHPEVDFGYPVHVVFVFDHQTTIDGHYWMTHDARGRWWIAALCRPG